KSGCSHCALAWVPLQPAAEQMMGDRKRVWPREALRMFPLQHQRGLGAVAPARVFQFRAIDNDVLVGCARGASDHQRGRIWPWLGHIIIHVGAANPGFLESLPPDGLSDGLGGL